jgi:hypothetical protein
VDLGLTAEDMMAVQDYTDNLRTKRRIKEVDESAATIIKREVQYQESQIRVSYKNFGVSESQWHSGRASVSNERCSGFEPHQS